MPEPTPAQRAIGDFAPKPVDLTYEVLFGDIWERPTTQARPKPHHRRDPDHLEQLGAHLRLAKQNGLTETELKEAIVHLAFYAGWPKAISAIQVAKQSSPNSTLFESDRPEPEHDDDE
jgi:4-carboxymuconolactone decarboxylase